MTNERACELAAGSDRSRGIMETEWRVKRSAEQLLEIFSRTIMTREVFFSKSYTRLKHIGQLEGQRIETDFFWKNWSQGLDAERS